MRHKKCPQCALGPVIGKTVEEEFQYGVDEDHVMLKATFPAFDCKACGFSFTDFEAEKARDEAVKEHLRS